MEMANITTQDVLKLARLSKLKLTEAELAEFSEEISQIMTYIEQLASVDVSGLIPTAQVTGLTNVMRKDEIIDYGVSTKDLLKNLPERVGNQIKVKRVLG